MRVNIEHGAKDLENSLSEGDGHNDGATTLKGATHVSKPSGLTKREWLLLQHKPNQSASDVSSSRIWPALISSTILFGGVNALVVWVAVKSGEEAYAVLALLVAMLFMNSICDLDVMGLLNNKRFRSNMNGNLMAYLLVCLFMLLFPAIAAVQGIQRDTTVWIGMCLIPAPTVAGFLNVLFRDRANVRRTMDAITYFKECQENTAQQS